MQEVSTVWQKTIEAAQTALVIATGEAESSAIVKDGHRIVIGGLIGETSQATESGVPLLKDIPILGFLFRTRGVSRQRTELAIFLTPYVVSSDEQADSLLRREQEQLPGMKQDLDSILAPRRP